MKHLKIVVKFKNLVRNIHKTLGQILYKKNAFGQFWISLYNRSKKKNNPPYSVTNYRRKMQLIPTIMDNCLHALDDLKNFKGSSTWGVSV